METNKGTDKTGTDKTGTDKATGGKVANGSDVGCYMLAPDGSGFMRVYGKGV